MFSGLVLLVMDGFLTLRLVRCGNAGVCGCWWLWMLVVVDACGCRCLWLWMLVVVDACWINGYV